MGARETTPQREIEWTARARRRWRALRTGSAFALFFLTALIYTTLYVPVWRRVIGNRGRPLDLRVQGHIHWFFGRFMAYMRRTGLVFCEVEGAERLQAPGPKLVIANHPTLVDVVALIACLPQADCVVKREHWNHFFLRGIVRVAGYIPNEGGTKVVAACADRLRQGRTLILFPEGTRSPQGGLGPFHRGAAHVALASGCDPVLVAISADPPSLMKGQAWYDVPERPIELRLRVEEPLLVKDHLVDEENRNLAARRLTAAMRERFQKRQNRVGSDSA
ncbi:MAG: 1-acyl-sn-glycerol-3-phosphate acyltransferase [Proteobacteria bacterium]|nr:1-acyl-sn-glycerol-3-phosphate acyltransferase [Pseudomonadota bacterium]